MTPRKPLLTVLLISSLLRGGLACAADLRDDPGLAAALAEAMAVRPELRRDEANEQAQAARAVASVSLPDPVLSLSYQNESFNRVEPGRMADSYPSIMLSQTLPTAGTRAARTATADWGVQLAQASADRTRLTLIADVRRAWIDLALARARLGVLSRAEALWVDAEAATRARYEAGMAPQVDLIRAQLQRTRLVQRRRALEADEHVALTTIDRLSGRAPTASVDTPTTLSAWADPPVPSADAARTDAALRSPEIRAADARAGLADAAVTLTRRERFPSLTLSAGVMPRWGQFESMWQLGLSTTLPVWTQLRQGPALQEATARQAAQTADQAAVRAVLEQRVSDRVARLEAAAATNRLYRSDLLVQSELAMGAAVAQYRSGAAPFSAVLDAGAGFLADEDDFLASVALAWRLWVELDEVRADGVTSVVSVPANRTGGPIGGSSGM